MQKIRQVSPFVSGTLILTATGFLSRFIGFFYRVFLSRTFGSEGMGIYQLVSPVLALSFSFCAAGIQTSISKYVATVGSASRERDSFHILLTGFLHSLFLSMCFSIPLYRYADFVAGAVIMEKRCAPLLRILALSIPFSSIHSCINGYYYGMKKTTIPSITQLIEQGVRVGTVYLLYLYSISTQRVLSIGCAVIGLVLGEFCSMSISILAVYVQFYPFHGKLSLPDISKFRCYSKKILTMACPLSANRMILNGLQSLEAIQIPRSLLLFGYNSSTALSKYGILTGMAFPVLFFPSAITNSMSVMLLPTVSEAESNKAHKQLLRTIGKSVRFSFFLGAFCCIFFLLFGKLAGILLFSNKEAGSYLTTLSFLCPFLYLSTTLSSILHGFGKTQFTFLFSVITLGIRLFFVFFFIPKMGLSGYLYGILCSELVHTLLLLLCLSALLRVPIFSLFQFSSR